MSLRSRIRGGQVYLTDKIATAAQFLTLRLIPIGSTHMGCDDSDGPGHAPRYLDVRRIIMMIFKQLSKPKPKEYLGEFEEKFKLQVEIVAYSPFGDLLIRDKGSKELAILFTQPFEVVPIRGKTVSDVNDIINADPKAANDIAGEKLVKACEKIHGKLLDEEIYTCEPFMFLGGDGKPKNRRRVKLWTYIELVSAMQ